MFTGIVTDIGLIEAVEPGSDLRLRIKCGFDLAEVDLGASIACSGVCFTVADKGEGWFAVDVSPETRSRTAPGMWEPGRSLNLERALRVGDELGGHIVTGHVDGVGLVSGSSLEGESIRFVIKAPDRLAPFLAEKGSVAINGVSLTVNEVEQKPDGVYFGITIIPHTRDTVAMFDQDDSVNIEIDVIARYLGRLLETRANTV